MTIQHIEQTDFIAADGVRISSYAGVIDGKAHMILSFEDGKVHRADCTEALKETVMWNCFKTWCIDQLEKNKPERYGK